MNVENESINLSHTLTSTFCGVYLAQYWDDLCLWEHVLNLQRFSGIVEIGTGDGGFSLFLALQCESRAMTFDTFEKVPERFLYNKHPMLKVHVTPHVHVGDVFGDQQMTLTQLLTAPSRTHPLIFFCDGGNKVLEYKCYTPILRVGDLCAVHDWETEIGNADIDNDLTVPRFKDLCEHHGSATRWFERR